jgi:hypothetical protein
MGWEYVVEIDGQGGALEVGDSELLTFPHDERVRVQIAERIRYQIRCAVEMFRPSTRRTP